MVLDMPDAGELDGVVVVIIKADQLTDSLAIIDVVREGTAMPVIPSAPVKEVDGFDGTYVLVNSVTVTEAPWAPEVQTCREARRQGEPDWVRLALNEGAS